MTQIVPVQPIEDEIRALAQRYRAADSVGMQLLNIVGGQAEGLLDRLPGPTRDRLNAATEKALQTALEAATRSRGVVPDQKAWLNTALTTAMGAAGGAGGLPSALAEVPVTVTVLMRAIQGIAAEHGFDPSDPEVAQDVLLVFSSAGPLAHDDGADMGFLAARVSITGAGLNALIARIAPRLATVLGQKLAAQAVPILGAAAGAAVNFAFTSYYQQMAHVQFGLKALAQRSGEPYPALVERLRVEMESKKLGRS